MFHAFHAFISTELWAEISHSKLVKFMAQSQTGTIALNEAIIYNSSTLCSLSSGEIESQQLLVSL